MAIAFDASSTNDSVNWGSGTSVTWSHTCTGSDRILFVAVFNLGSATLPSGITYNGVAMTMINSQDTDGGGYTESLWYLVAPSTGANNIVTTWAVSNGLFNCIATSYTGASQTGQPDSSNTGLALGVTSITTNLTTVANNCWLVGYARATGAFTFTNGTNGFIRNTGMASGSVVMADSNGVITPAGSTGMTLGRTSSSNIYHLVAAFKPVGSATNTNFFSMF